MIDALANASFIFGTVLAVTVIVGQFAGKRCDCAAPVTWWVARGSHPARESLWWLRDLTAVANTIVIIVSAVLEPSVSQWLLSAVWVGLCYFVIENHRRHRKHRRRRSVLRALGRVVVDAAGRLRIAPLPGPVPA